MKTIRITVLLTVCWTAAAFALRRGAGSDAATALLKKAKIMMADEQYEAALKKLKVLIADYPEDPKAEVALATVNHCYQIIGDMDEAYGYFDEVRRKHRGYTVSTVASYHAVPILIRRENYDEAIIRCNEIIAADSKSYWAIGALFNMAKMYCSNMGRQDEGIKIYKKIVKKYSNTQFARIAAMELKMLQSGR